MKSEKFPPIAQNKILSNCQRVPVFIIDWSEHILLCLCVFYYFVSSLRKLCFRREKNWDTVRVLRITSETSRNAIFSWRPTVYSIFHFSNFINGLNYRVEIWYINKTNILGVQRISKIRTIKFENKTIESFFGILIFAISKFRNVCRSMYISSL